MRYHLLHKYDEPEHVQRWELERSLARIRKQINSALDAYRLGDERMKASCVPVLNRLSRQFSEVKAQLASMEQEQVG